MKNIFSRSLRFSLVTLGIILLTSFTIDATDTLRGSQTALGIFATNVSNAKCEEGMTRVEHSNGSFCIDMYEVSPSQECIIGEPASSVDTAHNISQKGCVPVSEAEATPWTSVARPQAAELCAKAGKRLPTGEEWFLAALGTPDGGGCNTNGQLALAGVNAECVSGAGVFDMVGNVWEHTNETIIDGQYQERSLPEAGYVTSVDTTGVALETTLEPSIIYHDDYFWSQPEGYFTLIRGGFYGSRSDGGIYAAHAQTDQNFASAAIGFRCVK